MLDKLLAFGAGLMDWLPDWAKAVLALFVAVVVVRMFIGTLGVRRKLNEVDARILYASDAIVESLRTDINELKRDVAELKDLIRRR